MYRFVSSRNPVELKKAYLKEYDVNRLQKKLDRLIKANPEIADVMPDDISARKLLIGNFKYLAKVYCAFTGVVSVKSEDDRKAIVNSFKKGGFNYDSHKSDISRFLMNPANGFEIHNCVYCDSEDVTSFTKADGTKVRKFETEHVLDKGECPLIALSLYNFVPSCGTCNGSAVKGTKTIGDTPAEIVRLSPTVEGYDFENKVRFVVNYFNPALDDLNELTHPDDYEIAFDVKDDVYQKSIDLFQLRPRYNNVIPKSELLKWREKRRNNPDNIVRQFAEIRKTTFEVVFEEMFELDLRRQKHYPMEKARRDIMIM